MHFSNSSNTNITLFLGRFCLLHHSVRASTIWWRKVPGLGRIPRLDDQLFFHDVGSWLRLILFGDPTWIFYGSKSHRNNFLACSNNILRSFGYLNQNSILTHFIYLKTIKSTVLVIILNWHNNTSFLISIDIVSPTSFPCVSFVIHSRYQRIIRGFSPNIRLRKDAKVEDKEDKVIVYPA